MFLLPHLLIILCSTVVISSEQNYKKQDETYFAFNFTHIVFHSILLCGPNIICNKSLLAPFNLSNIPASGVNRCGHCSCHENCATFRSPSDCCPDIFFRHGLPECLDVKTLSIDKNYTKIIASCPVDTDEYLLKECTKKRSKVELLLNPPVSYSELSIQYMNEYCATCNGVSDGIKWNAEFRCFKETDFNYLSTFQEIVQLAIKEFCTVEYVFDINSNCLPDSDKLISKCNVSGSWVKYDKQIDQTCRSSYLAPIGIYKNMYCMMCNPPKYQKSLMIEECTNVRNVYKHACLNFQSLEASRPYKNYFCFLCNFDERNQNYFKDVYFWRAHEMLQGDPTSKNHLFNLNIVFDYNKDDLVLYINQYIKNLVKMSSQVPLNKNEYVSVRKSQPLCPSMDETFSRPLKGNTPDPLSLQMSHPFKRMEPTFSPAKENITINLNELSLKSFAFSRHGVCSQELLPNYTKPLQPSCSCDAGCIKNCCDDLAFKQSWICIDNQYKRDGKEKVFMAIDGCFRDPSLEPLCKGSFNEHFYHAFPVTKTSGLYETYLNIFCYLCNRNVKNGDIINERATFEIKVWQPLLLECRTYVNYRNFQSLQQLITFANKSMCIMSFSPPSTISKCKQFCYIDENYRRQAIRKCNVSGTWQSFDENVQKACEYTEPFRFPMIKIQQTIYMNKFCRICNPLNNHSFLDSNCNSDFEETTIGKACKEFPDTKGCSMFKHYFCDKVCSWRKELPCFFQKIWNHYENNDYVFPRVSVESREVEMLVGMQLDYTELGFRTFFTLVAYNNFNDTHSRKTNDTCKHNQMYDVVKDACRNLTCFPGRYLINGTCVPLLPFTSKLRYTLGLKINFSAFISINITVGEALISTDHYLSDQLKRTLNTEVFIEEIVLMGTEDCATAFCKLREIYVYIKIFIDQLIQREQVENTLLNFTQGSSDLMQHYTSLYFLKPFKKFVDISLSLQSIFLPSLLGKFDKNSTCSVFSIDHKYKQKLYRNTIVSPLLSCKQFDVHDTEFGIDWANIKEDFSFPGLNISVHPYKTLNNGGIRICVKDLLLLLEMQRKDQVKSNVTVLQIITVVCIAISLVSLAITFITYLFFPSLRTIPGLNNMCLVISLFMAQLSMISSTLFRATGLKIIYAFTHFSWLATFFWLQVCSFHMYRVFSAKSRSKFNGNQIKIRLMTKYGIYAFGLAAIIVGANIIITLIVSSGKYSGYDKISTLLTYKIAFIITVILPLIFVCMANILFYILTVYNIHSTPNVENKTGNRMHFSVYIKLFSITGLSWLLQIIDMFLEMSIFTYIVAILNGLQGLFIFLSYVCNQRVLKMYAGVCCKASRQYSSQSSRTSNTANTTL